MAASFGHIRAVNPYSLATVSGVTKIPGFASSPIPPVIRPDLLTGQLAGCHPQCEHCNGSHNGPGGTSGFASYIPPDYGTLRAFGADGEYGLFKMWSAQSSLPSGPGGGGLPVGPVIQQPGSTPQMAGLGKGAVGTNPASTYATRSWSHGLRGGFYNTHRGLGKGAVGTNPASVYATRSWSHGLRGLGQDFSSSGDPASDTLTTTYQTILNQLPSGGGAGGTGSVSNPLSEANQIVPTQNALMAYLGTITNQILTGQNPSVATLQQLYTNVWTAFANFIKFVLSPKFVVRMASGQALNTVMPYCDGSCGYAVPLGTAATPTQSNCIHWGVGSIGGDGTNGMLGAIGRAITNAGGTVPALGTPQQAANTGAATGTAPVPATGFNISSLQTTMLGGLSLTTWILIGLGFIVILRVGKR
jgi:hypothetical protein